MLVKWHLTWCNHPMIAAYKGLGWDLELEPWDRVIAPFFGLRRPDIARWPMMCRTRKCRSRLLELAADFEELANQEAGDNSGSVL